MESCFRKFSLHGTKSEPGGQAMGCRKSMEDRHTVISCLRPITQGGEAVVDVLPCLRGHHLCVCKSYYVVLFTRISQSRPPAGVRPVGVRVAGVLSQYLSAEFRRFYAA
eukprot:scaffold332508_cov42-Prasinocladus_malaysianus.AAC.1